MDKLKMHSKDWTDANIAKLAELFPNCVTEVRGTTEDTENTEKDRGSSSVCSVCSVVKRAIDFDLLRQELSDVVVDGPQERYRLDWPGKREALLAANAPIAKCLRPCREESVDFDTTENLFIEGDNLDALKLLQETYLGKVKMIYIDPPYNTGKDFIYADNFAESATDYLLDSGQTDEEGNRLVANTDSNGRFHSDWLSMMYSRLKLARNLLRDDGVIFISIDDGEVANIRELCNEVFGGGNFVTSIIWEKRKTRENRRVFSFNHDYILCYARDRRTFEDTRNLLPLTKEARARYSNPDSDSRGDWQSVALTAQAGHGTKAQFYTITTPSGRKVDPPSGNCWRVTEPKLQELVNDNRIWFGADGNNVPRRKLFLKEQDAGLTPHTLWTADEVGTTDSAKRALNTLFGGVTVFDTPKPVELIARLLQISSNTEDLVLDFFAGTAPLSHAVMQLNAEDGGRRKFIMVQLPEACDEKSEAYKAGYATIAEISKERIRRAGKKIKEELEPRNTRNTRKAEGGRDDLGLFGETDPSVSSVVKPDLDIGFRVLKVDSSNLADVYYAPDAVDRDVLFAATDNIKPDRSAEDLLFQVLLDWGVDLTLPISKEIVEPRTTRNTPKGDGNGNAPGSPGEADPSVPSVCSVVEKGLEVFFVDSNALAACFAKNGEVTEAFCRELAKRAPLRVVFRDAGFKDDSAKINAEQIFKQLSPRTEVRTL